MRKKTLEDFIEDAIKKHGNKYDYSLVNYIDSKTPVDIFCRVENHGVFAQTPTNHLTGNNCPKCAIIQRGKSKSKANIGNSIRDKTPELIEYLVNKSDADNYTFMSTNKKIDMRCPNCGFEKPMTPNNANKQGFCCPVCSDKGVSIPEKFGINVFTQLGIKFKTQKTFKWSDKRKYDMYFELENKRWLVEIMGIQHYEECGFYGIEGARTLLEEQANDLYKYNLARQHGIGTDNYIVVDARHSTFEHLRFNFKKSLETHFDLSSINWECVWENSIKSSRMIEAINLWNSGIKNTVDIGKIIHAYKYTVSTYLKNGAILGLCDYDPKQVLKDVVYKNSQKSKELRSVGVSQFSKDGVFIASFTSACHAARELGVFDSPIGSVCRGRNKTAYGFIWKYTSEVERND